MRIKRFLMLSVMAVAAAGALMAQVNVWPSIRTAVPWPTGQSLKSGALLFTTDADKYMDPNDYKEVKFGSFFAEAQGSVFNASTASYVGGGFAKYFGATYVGAYVDGYFMEGPTDELTYNDYFSVLIGTESFGAFKPYFFSDFQNTTPSKGGTALGLGWGINLDNGMKPEVALGYYFDTNDSNAYKGIIYIGAVLGGALTKGSGEGFYDISYHGELGLPSENDGRFQHHAGAAWYRKHIPLAEGFTAAWGAGVLGDYTDTKTPTVAVPKRLYVLPTLALGFDYKIWDLFSVNAEVLYNYMIDWNDDGTNKVTTLSNVIHPVIGGVFSPHEYFSLELQWNTGFTHQSLPSVGSTRGLDSINPTVFSILAIFKK